MNVPKRDSVCPGCRQWDVHHTDGRNHEVDAQTVLLSSVRSGLLVLDRQAGLRLEQEENYTLHCKYQIILRCRVYGLSFLLMKYKTYNLNASFKKISTKFTFTTNTEIYFINTVYVYLLSFSIILTTIKVNNNRALSRKDI